MFLPSCSGTDLLKELEMQPANIPAVLLAIALAAACWAASGLVAPATAAEEPARAAADALERRHAPSDQALPQASSEPLPMLAHWSDRLVAVAAQARALLAAGYERAPALVLVLSALLVLPAAALVSFLVQSAARRKKEHAASRALQLRAGSAEFASETPSSDAAPLWSHQAWLTPEDTGAGTLPLAGHMIRIGRHQDNDIRLPDTSVHRYHAVIEHTPDEEFVITDLSGKDGNGVRVNGERLARAQLADGDVIELGRTRLKFESVPV
jgi:hypothetical protein